MTEQPDGPVTFLFTDVVGSARLWAADESAMSASLRRHDELVREAIEQQGGDVFTTAGDAFCAAFSEPHDAVRAALIAQRSLARTEWPGPALSVRFGINSGHAERRGGDYFGSTVNTTARLTAIANGGQIIAIAGSVPSTPGSATIDLGEHRLRDVADPVGIVQIGDGSFPPLTGQAGADVLRFDDVVVDTAGRELIVSGSPVHVEPQVFDVLACLIESRHRMMTHEELLDEVWGDQFVSPSALTTRIKSARQAIGDDGRTQRYIRTEHGRGYRFVGTIAEPGTDDRADVRAGSRAVTADATTVPTVDEPLLGRDAEAQDVLALLDASRLVTLTGPGGMGKTRLSIELARRWSEGGAGRAASFVPLEEVRSPDDLPGAVATALGLDTSGSTDPTAACADWITTGDRLVVLDNCEHLLEAASTFTDRVLDGTGSATILATSREPLRLRTEQVYRLDPLSLPPDELDPADHDGESVDPNAYGPCIQLFTDRASRVDADFRLTRSNAPLVAGLCRRLDGLPLGIELAASRIGSLDIADLVDTLSSRLDVMHAPHRDADDRHRSLRSTIDWSYRLLSGDARTLFDAMARFPGGLRLTEINDLADRIGLEAPTADVLAQLVDTSMIYRSESAGSRRYRMLETLRHFGNEQLAGTGAAGRVDDALVAHAASVSGDERRSWIERVRPPRSNRVLRDEIPNLRAARDVLADRDDHAALVAMTVDLAMATEQLCLGELWSWHDEAETAESSLPAEAQREADLLVCIAHRNSGRHKAAITAADEIIADVDDPWIEALAWHERAMSSLFLGRLTDARDAWARADELTGHHVGRIFGAMCLGYLGEVDAAEDQLDECHVVLDGGRPYIVAAFQYVSGETARIAGSPTAIEALERAVATCVEHDLYFTLGISRVSLVSLWAAAGETEKAAQGYAELVEQWLRSGSWPQMWITLRNAAELLVERDDETALLLWAGADADPQATALDDDARSHIDSLRAGARTRCGADAAAAVERSARRVSRRDVVARALDALATAAQG